MTATEGLLSREEMERRRLAAAKELLNGTSQSKVARRYGVSRTTTSRWYHALTYEGVESLQKRRATGRPSRLTADQLEGVAKIYAQGALAHGFDTDRWTTARLAIAIEAQFGVHYDQDHVGRIMHKLGLRQRAWTYQPVLASAPQLVQAAI